MQLEEQAKNRKLLADDLDLVTNHKIHYPEAYNELRHVTKNLSCPAHKLEAERSVPAQEMRNVVNRVAKFSTDYTYHFKEFNGFGAFFVNKIHIGIQKFIHSCAMG